MIPDNRQVDCAQLNTLLSLMQQTGRASGRSTHVKHPSNKRGNCNMGCIIGQLHCRYDHAGVRRTDHYAAGSKAQINNSNLAEPVVGKPDTHAKPLKCNMHFFPRRQDMQPGMLSDPVTRYNIEGVATYRTRAAGGRYSNPWARAQAVPAPQLPVAHGTPSLNHRHPLLPFEKQLDHVAHACCTAFLPQNYCLPYPKSANTRSTLGTLTCTRICCHINQ